MKEKSFWVAERFERDGDRDDFAVLKDGDDMVERLEPGLGEGIRGVAYWELVGERREEAWWVRVEGVFWG